MISPLSQQDSIGNTQLIIITANHYLKKGIYSILMDLLPGYIQRTEKVLHAHFYPEIEDIPEICAGQPDVSHIIIDETSMPCSFEVLGRVAKKVPNCRKYLFLDAQTTPYPGQYPRLSAQLPVEDVRQQILHFLSADSIPSNLDLSLVWQALTPREKLILSLLAQGVDVRQIAQQLAITVQTVYACRNRAMKKAGVSRLLPLLQQMISSSDIRYSMSKILNEHKERPASRASKSVQSHKVRM